jgi:hypothetical protein
MKNKTILVASAFSFLFGGAAIAQSFTYEVVWKPLESVGGMTGPNGQRGGAGGVVDGSYTTTYQNGTVQKGTVRCVGMQQPDNGLFDIHMSCTTKEATGAASVIWGCNYLGDPGPQTPLGCVGGIQGTAGEVKGRNGLMTMEWYSTTASRGTGQWYANK